MAAEKLRAVAALKAPLKAGDGKGGKAGGKGGKGEDEDEAAAPGADRRNVFDQLKAQQDQSTDDIMRQFLNKQRRCKIKYYCSIIITLYF